MEADLVLVGGRALPADRIHSLFFDRHLRHCFPEVEEPDRIVSAATSFAWSHELHASGIFLRPGLALLCTWVSKELLSQNGWNTIGPEHRSSFFWFSARSLVFLADLPYLDSPGKWLCLLSPWKFSAGTSSIPWGLSII